MQKSFALILAVCFSLAGCQVFQKSETWEKVMQVRPGDAFRDPDPSAAYAEKLHRALLEGGVEHLVVTYQYHYFTHHRDEAVGTRTAIVYRDPATPRYPWWLKDERLNSPVWLPNGDLAGQIGFYIREKAEVIEQKSYPARGGIGKATVAISGPVAAPAMADSHAPAAVTKIAPAKPSPTPVSGESVAVARSTKMAPIVSNPTPPATPTPAPSVLTKIERTFAKIVPWSKPKAEAPPVAPVAEYQSSPTSSAVRSDAPAASSELPPSEEHFEKLFRLQNGTRYDRTSAMDRRKMQQIKHSVANVEASGEREMSHGVDGSLIHPQF